MSRLPTDNGYDLGEIRKFPPSFSNIKIEKLRSYNRPRTDRCSSRTVSIKTIKYFGTVGIFGTHPTLLKLATIFLVIGQEMFCISKLPRLPQSTSRESENENVPTQFWNRCTKSHFKYELRLRLGKLIRTSNTNRAVTSGRGRATAFILFFVLRKCFHTRVFYTCSDKSPKKKKIK